MQPMASKALESPPLTWPISFLRRYSRDSQAKGSSLVVPSRLPCQGGMAFSVKSTCSARRATSCRCVIQIDAPLLTRRLARDPKSAELRQRPVAGAQ